MDEPHFAATRHRSARRILEVARAHREPMPNRGIDTPQIRRYITPGVDTCGVTPTAASASCIVLKTHDALTVSVMP
jgi:hypothetical protein